MNPNKLQLERYNQLLVYLGSHFKEQPNSQKIEQIVHYSYRNINRIFKAVQNESIGQYIQRLRLEKAAEFLKYSATPIYQIATELGYTDLPTFSKAFKQHFNCSPSNFRLNKAPITPTKQAKKVTLRPLNYSITTLPNFSYYYLQHQGKYSNTNAIENLWNDFLPKTSGFKNPIYFGIIMDDEQITPATKCRYRAGVITDTSNPKNELKQATINSGKFAKTLCTNQQTKTTYNNLIQHLYFNENKALRDAPALEFYHIDKQNRTEIYLPIE